MNKYFAALAAAAFAGTTLGSPELNRISSFEFGITNTDGGVAEISTYDALSKKLCTASAELGGVVVTDYSNPLLFTPVDTLSFTADMAGESRTPNSVSAHNGVLAVAVERVDSVKNSAEKMVHRHLTGDVVLFDLTKTDHPMIARYEVGNLPDMVTFSQDGKKLVVANEGEPSSEYLADPEGSISVIDLSAGMDKGVVTTLDFKKFNADSLALATAGVVLDGFKGASVAQDLEPEYCAVSTDGTRAWVTLQENNALALVDLVTPAITAITPLFRKDLSLAGNRMDLVADKKFELANFAVTALPMPDGIASYSALGKEYLLIANEGDGRDYGGAFINETKISKVITWAPAFDKSTTTAIPDLVLHAGESTNSVGEIDKLVIFGGRSFSVLDDKGALIWDSGEEFEQITGTLYGEAFNTSHTPGKIKVDNRSPKKGPEPESVTTGIIDGKRYAFIGLERIGGVMMYDLSTPEKPVFVQYMNKRDFTLATPAQKDVLGPEGILFVPADKSPTEQPLLIVSNEVSGTIETFGIGEPSVINQGSIALSSLNITANRAGLSLVIPATQNISVRLFSLNGREIGTLHSGKLSAGTHQLSLPHGVASGAYLVLVETDREQIARKISF